MTNYQTKHEFVDDNRYLAYASEPDTAMSNTNGGGGGALLAGDTYSQGETYLNCTFEQVRNAISEGKTVWHVVIDSGEIVFAEALTGILFEDDAYYIAFGSATYVSTNPTDYPVEAK